MNGVPYAVLYVDDETANLSAFAYLFEGQFRVLTARSGVEALELLAREKVAVLLTDQRMPQMTGAQLCGVVRERWPEVVRMVVTAYADLGAAMEAINSGQVARYILKPWQESELAEMLVAGIEAYQLGAMTRDLQLRLLAREQQTTSTFLVGRVLHELGNPAASINANVRWMGDNLRELRRLMAGTEEERKRGVGMIDELQAATRDLVEGTEELLRRIDLFRRGEMPPQRGEMRTDLGKAVHAALSIVRAELRDRARLDIDLEPMPPVRAEATQLSQILVNLLTNAGEAIGAGKPNDNVVLVRARARDRQAVLQISDSGPGISPQLLPRVFEPFVSSKGDDHNQSRGFGLALVRDIVERVHGEIEVTSALGKGTTFTITLPLAEP